jgi:adenine deaminase
LEEVQEELENRAARKRLGAGTALVSERYGRMIGRLREGAAADVLVTGSDRNSVRHVLVNGNVLVEDGILRTGDVEAIRKEAQKQAVLLWERMKAL